MNSIILCEGFDDVLILGYYLRKTQGWTYNKNGKLSELYDLPKVNPRNQIIEVYEKSIDKLAIWCVGGKDSFRKAFEFVRTINYQHPNEGIQKLFMLSDRDESEISECLRSMEKLLTDIGIGAGRLNNNEAANYQYEIEKETYLLKIIPVIIPMNEAGALETVLLSAIEETSEEDSYVVQQAKRYIEDLVSSNKLKKYLQHHRLILKAKFSAAISVTNPDRSTAMYDALLMSNSWEEKKL